MPGNVIHLGGAPKEFQETKLGRLGLIAPDYWKWEKPTLEDYKNFFEGCENAPTYEEVEYLCSLEHGGTHFGSEQGDTNHADFGILANAFNNGKLDKTNPFYLSYVHHLRLDKCFYANPDLFDQISFENDYSKDDKETMKRLHLDWDNTNDLIQQWFPKVCTSLTDMPQKVKDIVKFVEGKPKYVQPIPLKAFMEKC